MSYLYFLFIYESTIICWSKNNKNVFILEDKGTYSAFYYVQWLISLTVNSRG